MKNQLRKLTREKITQLSSNEPLLKRFLERVRIPRDYSGCWFIREDWSVYAVYNKEPAHRYSYRTFHPDESIEGREICHKCDRPGCINPAHLFKGTHLDNMRDAISKGRLNPKKSKFRFKVFNAETEKLRREDNRKQLDLPIDFIINSYHRGKSWL